MSEADKKLLNTTKWEKIPETVDILQVSDDNLQGIRIFLGGEDVKVTAKGLASGNRWVYVYSGRGEVIFETNIGAFLIVRDHWFQKIDPGVLLNKYRTVDAN